MHSPVAREPAAYGVTLQQLSPDAFAKNNVGVVDPTGFDHDVLGLALKKALYDDMHGIGLDEDLRRWLTVRVSKRRVARGFIVQSLAGRD